MMALFYWSKSHELSKCSGSPCGSQVPGNGKERTIMLDLVFIRNNPEIVKEAARLKNNTLDIDYLLEVDRKVVALQRQVEEERAQQNQLSKRIQGAGKDKELRETL